jgi:hypothetical protein
MTSVQRIETINFLENLKRDLIKQVLQNIKDGHEDNIAEGKLIRDLNKQINAEKELAKVK